MKIKELHGTSTIAWSPDVIPLLACGSVAGAVDLDFSSLATLEIWEVFGLLLQTPIFSAAVEHKFYALAWLSPFEGHPRGVLVGALENGTVQFWDVATLNKTKSLADASVHTSTKHLGIVKCLLFNRHQPHVLATGGQHSEIFIWDLKTFADPISPGRPTTPMDEISCISWNNAVSHILASTSNAEYTSIWDLKAKREVLHLAYAGPLGRADFSHVAWHPTQSTKLITASQSDTCPLILSWDLRNAAEPEKILQGHTKGVLSLDWCSQDANLLISSGKDNSTRLWNPITGVKLGDYPNAANWSFLTRFAPKVPDVIATASFDGKVVIQTLQETSTPVSDQVATKNDDEFWSTISTANTQQAVFEVSQAPEWLKRPCSATFGFGSKLITVRNALGKGSVQISKHESGKIDHHFTKELSAAIKLNDFKGLLASKLEKPTIDSADWEVLLELERLGKTHFLQAIVGNAQLTEVEPQNEVFGDDAVPAEDNNEELFFASLSKDIKVLKGISPGSPFVPSGDFAIIDQLQLESEARLTKLLLANKISQAVSVCLDEGKLLEALVLSMDEHESVKKKVKSRFFEQTKSEVLSRLIYSASSKDVVDIVSNADISNWKEIAVSIAAYCKEESDFNSKTVELGDRIMANGSSSKENRQNALLCYLAGNALDKVSAIWLAELPELEHLILTSEGSDISSPHDARYIALAGFVEKVSVYRSLSNLGGALSGPSIEPVCKAVFEFSNMSASNGDFELASQFLAILPDDFAGLKTENERIAKATAIGPEVARQNIANGVSKNQTRYTNMRAAAHVAPAQLLHPQPHANVGRAPPMPLAPVKPVSVSQQPRGYASVANSTYGAPQNPYLRAAVADRRGSSFGGQFLPPRNNSLGITTSPVMLLYPTGSIRPPSSPTFTQPFVQPQQYNAEVQDLVNTPGNNTKFKLETEGWNDLPETFKASNPPARRTPASSAVIVLSPSTVAQTVQGLPPKRPQASHVIAPPPKAGSRVVSKSSIPGTPRTTSSPKPSKYAPLVQPSPAFPPNGFVPNGVPSSVQTPKVTAPPKNPYAPTVVPQTKTTYATPPANNFVAPPTTGLPRTASQVVNPYSPGVRASLRSMSNGSMIDAASHGSLPPVSRISSISACQSPVQQPEPSLAPPPRMASNRYSSPQTHQVNGFGHVAPPPVTAVNHAAPSPVPGVNVGPPPVSAVSHVGPPQLAPVNQKLQPAAVASPPPAVAKTQPGLSGQSSSSESITGSFAAILNKIKPTAPPKYAKHVFDMEKRLGILFETLSKEASLSPQTVDLLSEIAKSLKEKNYQNAMSFNQQIVLEFPVEAGTWHTGVKRLITMAEAFEI